MRIRLKRLVSPREQRIEPRERDSLKHACSLAATQAIQARMQKLAARLERWPDVSGVKRLTGDLAGRYRLRGDIGCGREIADSSFTSSRPSQQRNRPRRCS